MEVIDSYEHADVTIEIVHDDDQSSSDPQQNDNAGHITLWGAARDYTIGDEQIRDPDLTEDCPVCEGAGMIDGSDEPTASCYDQRTCSQCQGDGLVPITLVGYFQRCYDAALVIPLQFLDGRYDGRLEIAEEEEDANGVIYFTQAEIDKEWSGHVEPYEVQMSATGEVRLYGGARRYAEARIKEYDNYLQGNVLGIRVLDPEDDELESVWGYIGDWYNPEDRRYIKVEAESMAEGAAEALERERRERHEWACRDVVTVG